MISLLRNCIKTSSLLLVTAFLIAALPVHAMSPIPTPSPTPTPTSTVTPTPSPVSYQYSLDQIFDKVKVSEDETVQLSITVKNIGMSDIPNFELRVPFLKSLQDTQSVIENPSFNKLLVNSEYPSGFQDRSWLINPLPAGVTKTFTVRIAMSSSIAASQTVQVKAKLPNTWFDPAGLESGKDLLIDYFRTDVYVNSSYKESFKAGFPKIDTINNKITGLKLSGKYYFSGSKTTDFKQINDTNITAFSPFVIDTPDTMIEWKEPVDFSSAGTLEKMKKLDDLLKIEWGVVDFVKSDDLLFLQKKATITFRNLDFVNAPQVRVGTSVKSVKDSESTYDSVKKTLEKSFDTKVDDIFVHPDLVFESNLIKTNDKKFTFKGKATDARSKIEYEPESDQKQTIDYIDLNTGEFDVLINDSSKSKQVKITSELKNKEKVEKIILVEYSAGTTNTGSTNPGSISAIFNPITLALSLSALAVVIFIGGYIYYLRYKKKKAQNQKSTNISQLYTLKQNSVEITSNYEKPVDQTSLLKDE